MNSTLIKVFVVSALTVIMASCCGDQAVTSHYLSNRAPLAETAYLELPIGAIKADGWLQEQLERQRSGMTGHMDSIYVLVDGPRNAWLGGDGDCWERGPYWIDGLLPLAYLLDDEELKAKAKPWVEWALASQKENGFFGPDIDREPEWGMQRDNSQDWWPRMVVLKILKQHYQATGDERVIPFMTRYFKYQLEQLPQTPIDHWTYWGGRRAGDNSSIVYWLYNITGDEFLLDLGELIHQQSHDWTGIHGSDTYDYTSGDLHCVNLAQGFKEPAVYWQQSKDDRYLDALHNGADRIREQVGLPTGLWGGDENVYTDSPTAGSELCTAVEMMFSLEEILRITGDVRWADYLERVAYNALPTQIDDDFSSKQYYQQTNQVMVTKYARDFTCPHDDTDILFGELTGYPCCASNMHQGWPKFTQNLWYATSDRGAAAIIYAPSEVNLKVADGTMVNIKEVTDYPFSSEIAFEFTYPGSEESVSFPFSLRVPQWCDAASIMINGEVQQLSAKAGETVRIDREWKNGDVLVLTLPMRITASRWHEGAVSLERGPLLYALKMNEVWEKKKFSETQAVTFNDWYYEVTSDTPWNVALDRDRFADPDNYEVVEKPVDGYPWNVENAPVVLRTRGEYVKFWTLYNESAGPIRYRHMGWPANGEDVDIELIPYGCTTLRIAEFPIR